MCFCKIYDADFDDYFNYEVPYNKLMIPHILEFLTNYFTHLNLKKILGGILAIVGIGMLGQISMQSNINKGILFAFGGIIIGSVGLIIIYIDMANDKKSSEFNELDTISKAYKQKAHEDKNISTWHTDNEIDSTDSSSNNKQ